MQHNNKDIVPKTVYEFLRNKTFTIDYDNGSYLNLFRIDEIKIEYNDVNILINNHLLIEDSGNFETGETHYVFNNESRIIIRPESYKVLEKIRRRYNLVNNLRHIK